MNRRGFLASFPFVPSAVKAVAVALADVPLAVAPVAQWAYQADSRGIHQMLRDCGKCVEPAPIDLDAILQRIYAVRKRSHPYGQIIDCRSLYLP